MFLITNVSRFLDIKGVYMSFCLMKTHCKACSKAEAQEETAKYSKLRIQILWGGFQGRQVCGQVPTF